MIYINGDIQLALFTKDMLKLKFSRICSLKRSSNCSLSPYPVTTLLPWYVSVKLVVILPLSTVTSFETCLIFFLISKTGKNAQQSTATPTSASFQLL
jgi:hypothetical protein